MKMCNEMLKRTLELTERMVEIADQGDGAREDVGCGVLYGLLRDSAFKIRKVAEEEIESHIKKGSWPATVKGAKRRGAEKASAGAQGDLNTRICGRK